MLEKLFSIFKPKALHRDVKILVIEDTMVDQRVACAAIEKGGYTAITAVDGKSGVAMAKEQKPQLIIMDYNLPDTKGPDICKLLKANLDTQQIPVLYLTSDIEPDHVINCFEQGENYLAKPISPKLLLKQIDQILNNPT